MNESEISKYATLTCRHCQQRVYRRGGERLVNRYALTTCADGTDICGSGSECLANDTGHETASHRSVEPGPTQVTATFTPDPR